MKENIYLPIYSLSEWHYCPRSAFLSWVGAERKDEVTPAYQRMRQEHLKSSSSSTRRRRNIRIETGVPLVNQSLRIVGKADAVEWSNGKPFPVEYKNSPQMPPIHILVQVTLQAMCLSEMFKTEVERGYVYRLKEKRRVKVKIDSGLNNTAIKGVEDFRRSLSKGISGFRKNKQDGCVGCIYRANCWPEKYYDIQN